MDGEGWSGRDEGTVAHLPDGERVKIAHGADYGAVRPLSALIER